MWLPAPQLSQSIGLNPGDLDEPQDSWSFSERMSLPFSVEQPYIQTYKNPRSKGSQQDIDPRGVRSGKQEVPVVMLENNS